MDGGRVAGGCTQRGYPGRVPVQGTRRPVLGLRPRTGLGIELAPASASGLSLDQFNNYLLVIWDFVRGGSVCIYRFGTGLVGGRGQDQSQY